MTYSSNKASVDNLIEELKPSANGRILSSHKADMASDADLKRLFEEIQSEHGQGVDILIANAGHGKRVSNILEIEIEEWDYTINVNLRASFILTKLAVKHMIEKNWGRIVYISSIAAGSVFAIAC